MADERDIDLVLVTGAGASCAFGVNGTSLPLMATWSDHLVRKLREAPMGYLAATGLTDGMQAEQFERRLGDFLRSVNAFKSIDSLLGPVTAIDRNLRPQANDAEWGHWHETLSFQLDQIVAVIHKSLYEMFGAPKFDPRSHRRNRRPRHQRKPRSGAGADRRAASSRRARRLNAALSIAQHGANACTTRG